MTQTQPDPQDRRDVPDAAGGALSDEKRKTMSDQPVSRAEFERVKRQAIERKKSLEKLEKERDEWRTKYESSQAEHDEAIEALNSMTEQVKQFTSENTLYQHIEALQREIRDRDAIEAFSQLPEGLDYQPGVTLKDLFDAAGVDPDSIEEFSPEVVSDIVSRAKEAKSYLFNTQPATGGPGDVRPLNDPQAQAAQQPQNPAIRAFGAQAIGGGAANPSARANPAQTVDWSDPAAVLAYKPPAQ